MLGAMFLDKHVRYNRILKLLILIVNLLLNPIFWIVSLIHIQYKSVIEHSNPNSLFKMDWQSNSNPIQSQSNYSAHRLMGSRLIESAAYCNQILLAQLYTYKKCIKHIG